MSFDDADPHGVEREIRVLESTAFHWLRFSSALEEKFEAATAVARTSRILVNGILSVILYNLFLISDYQIRQTRFSHFLIVRLGFATPPAIVGLLMLRAGVGRRVRESIVVVVCFLFGVSILYLYAGESAAVSAFTLTDLVILILFTNVGFHIRLGYALVASLICLALGGIFLQADSMLSGSQKFEGGAVLLVGALLSMLANYNMERGERLNFLLRLRSEVRATKLALSNQHLLRLSHEDKLTLLPNRRSFDELYKTLWQDSIRSAATISIIMIDIDNFKDLNDRYGHLYGDAVLRRIAGLLPPALRVKGDFVARYGGEEFVVVLPNASAHVAFRVAERIRRMIELAGSPPPTLDTSRDHGWSTVSCGVATLVPHMEQESSCLIELADKALYRAKAEGRNRVCC